MNLKKSENIFISLVLVFGLAMGAWASITRKGTIGPAHANESVTIPAAGTNNKNCIADLDVTSFENSNWSFHVLDGGTTIWAVDLSSDTGFIRSWDDEDALCSSNNTALHLNITAATTAQINYGGFVK